MTKIYLIMLICAITSGAYFYGVHVGNSKCEIGHFQNQINISEQNKTNERIVNDTVYKTGVVDIRRILRDKYTIAD